MGDVPVDGNGATVHGTYDYWLRGSSHRPRDRELGEAIAARFPLVPAHIRAAHDFTLRAARWAALRGISRFIRAGAVTYLRGRNVHDAARKVNPAAEVAYVNRDAGAHALAGALLSSGRLTSAVRAAVGEPGALLASSPVGEWVREGSPVCMIIGMILTFVSPEVAPGLVAAYAKALPPGSVIALTVALADHSPEAEELAAMFTPEKVCRHRAEDVTAWLAGAGLEIAAPGVADVHLIPGGPHWAAGQFEARPPGIIAGGLAVKP